MHQFKDTAGRAWEVTINVATIKRVRGLLQIDIAGLLDDDMKPLAKLLDDPVALVDVLYLLCVNQDKVSDWDFGSAMGGEVLVAAADAFVEELADFFQRPKGANLRKLMAKVKEMAKQAQDKAAQELDAIDPEALLAKLIASSGAARASSASTPAPSLSAN